MLQASTAHDRAGEQKKFLQGDTSRGNSLQVPMTPAAPRVSYPRKVIAKRVRRTHAVARESFIFSLSPDS